MEQNLAERQAALARLQNDPDEEALWECIVAFQEYEFRTFSGLPFSYRIKRGKHGDLTRELWIDRRQNSKSLAWSSVVLAFRKVGELDEKLVERPKALGDIRGISYIYGIFYRFGLIDVPQKAEEKMRFWD